MKKLLTALILAALLSLFPLYFAHAETLSIFRGAEGEYLNFEEDSSPFVNSDGRTMFPLDACGRILKGNVSYTVEDGSITIAQEGLDYTTTLQLQVGSTVMYINGEAAELDAAPANIDGVLYFPLRAVAQAFEHSVYWESRFPDSSEIYVIYTAAELYIWNTEEEFSDGSLRYALLQGTLDEKPFEEIYSRATPDYHELLNRLSAAPVNGITLCPLYPIKGYKVPESIVHDLGNKIHCGNYLSAGSHVGYSERCLDEIPPIITVAGDSSDWFSRQLYALREPSLSDSKQQVYRYTMIPSFSMPYTVRVEIGDAGTGRLYFTVCDGPINYYGGDIVKSVQKALTKEETDALLGALTQANFWNIPASGGQLGFDGYRAIFEGVKDGKYHFFSRWSPDDAVIQELEKTFRSLCEAELDEAYKKQAEQYAYDTLNNAEVFTYAPGGLPKPDPNSNTLMDGNRPREAEAFRTLFASENALNYFVKLEADATTAGKLYALCALYHLDSDNYQDYLKKYIDSDASVLLRSGCVTHSVEIRNYIKGGTQDFYSGDIPKSLINYITNNNYFS